MTALIKYDAACRAIAECRQVDEIKGWTDKAAAMEAYGRVSKNYELERDAAEIRIRAERRLGQLLMEMPKNVGAQFGAPAALRSEEGRPKLAEMGISYNQSARAQSIARIPEPQFEQTLAEHREEQRKVTGRTMAKLTQQAAEVIPPPPDEARLYDDLMAAWNRATPPYRPASWKP